MCHSLQKIILNGVFFVFLILKSQVFLASMIPAVEALEREENYYEYNLEMSTNYLN